MSTLLAPSVSLASSLLTQAEPMKFEPSKLDAAPPADETGTFQAVGDKLTNLFDTGTGVFSRGDLLAQPEHLLDALMQLSGIWAVTLLVLGVLTLFNGYRWYKLVVVFMALMLGSFTGYWVGTHTGGPMVLAACFGLLLAICSWPLMKYACAMFGGLAGAFVGANAWSSFASVINQQGSASIPVDAYWIGALFGLVLFGLSAFLIFKFSVVTFTSVGGATMAVLGAIALLLSHNGIQSAVRENLGSSSVTLPIVVFVAATIGLVIQQANWAPQGERD